jgi:hypothetical protein
MGEGAYNREEARNAGNRKSFGAGRKRRRMTPPMTKPWKVIGIDVDTYPDIHDEAQHFGTKIHEAKEEADGGT